MKFKLLVTVLFSLGFSLSTLAQTVPILPKEWSGTASVTSYGAVTQHNPSYEDIKNRGQATDNWNFYEGKRALTIVRQQGRHLELLYKSPKYEEKMIGTIFDGGKKIQVTSKDSSSLWTIENNKIEGCGTGRGGQGTFENWLNNIDVFCVDFTAVK
jgi:hypothetical protein